MITFIGDYNCKLDAKGRASLPSAFKKQMGDSHEDRFVIKKDIFEKCLVLYPMSEWLRQNKLIRQKTNPYNREHNSFVRRFFKETYNISLDNNNRILIPRKLLEDVGIDNEAIMAGQYGKIEIWSKHRYEQIEVGDDEFANLAENIMKGLTDETNE